MNAVSSLRSSIQMNDVSNLKDFIHFMPYSALIGGALGCGLSFTAIPILAAHACIAALITTALGIFLYKRSRSSDQNRYLKLLGICATSMIITGMLMFINPLLSGVTATMLGKFIDPSLSVITAISLIAAVTGLVSPLCTGLSVKTLNHMWKAKYHILVCAVFGTALSLVVVFPSIALIAGITAIHSCVLLCSIMNDPVYEKLSEDGQKLCTTVAAAAVADVLIATAIHCLFPILFPNLMLESSWQKVLAYAAIMTVTVSVVELLGRSVVEFWDTSVSEHLVESVSEPLVKKQSTGMDNLYTST